MVPNPSHLEAVNPVAMGKVRARMLSKRTGPYSVNQNEESNVRLFTQFHMIFLHVIMHKDFCINVVLVN